MTAAHLSVQGIRETKKATFCRKKKDFWAKKLKKMVLWGFQVRTWTFPNVTVSHQGHSDSQNYCLNGSTRCWNKIEAFLLKIKLRFRPKNVKERGFSAVFRSALEHFWIWLFDSNDAQTYKLVVRLKSKVEAKVKKKSKLLWKKFAVRAKGVKNGLSEVFISALKRFGFLLYDSDDPWTHKLAVQSDERRVATKEKEWFGKYLRFVL